MCPNKTLNIGHGKIDVTSPFYPIYYPRNVDCFWRITTAQLSGHFVITFVHVNLQTREDFLAVGIGSDIVDSSVILRLTGNASPRIISINNSTFWLRFTSNSLEQISYNGFWLQIELTDSYGNSNSISLFLFYWERSSAKSCDNGKAFSHIKQFVVSRGHNWMHFAHRL